MYFLTFEFGTEFPKSKPKDAGHIEMIFYGGINNSFFFAAYGSLVTIYPIVSFRNVTSSSCRCDLGDYLLDGSYDLSNKFLPGMRKEELTQILTNETFCVTISKVERLTDLCPEALPHVRNAIDPTLIGALVGSLVSERTSICLKFKPIFTIVKSELTITSE